MAAKFGFLQGFFKRMFLFAGEDLGAWVTGTETKIPASAIEAGAGAATPTDPNAPWTAPAGLTDAVGQRAIFSDEIYVQVLAGVLTESNWQLTTADVASEITVAATPTNYSPAGASAEQHLAAVDTEIGVAATHAASTTNPHVTTLQGAHDAGSEIRGQTDLGSASFDSNFGTPFTFGNDGVVLPIFTEDGDLTLFAVGGSGASIAQFNETLVARATRTVVSNTPDVVNLGTDLTAIDDGLGAQLGGVDQFPSILIAFTDAGVKISIGVSIGGVGDVELTVAPPVAGFAVPLTTDTWQGGAAGQIPMMLVKRIMTIDADGIVGFTGRQMRNRQIGSSQVLREDDFWAEIIANNVDAEMPDGDEGDTFVVYNSASFTGATITPNSGFKINSGAVDAAISLNGSNGVIVLRRQHSGDWVAEGSGLIAGLTETLTFNGLASGDVTSLTLVDGDITARVLVP